MQDLGIRVLFIGNNMQRLLLGLWETVQISLIAVILSIFLGIILGMAMTVKNPALRAVTKVYLEVMRIMPQLVMLFIVFFGLTKAFGINLSGRVSAVIVFTLWGTAEMGDLVRGALISIPPHQYESGAALAMTKLQVYIYVVIPQTVRRLIPLAINLTTRMIKTTTLVVLIGVVEVLKVGQQIIEANRYTYPSAAFWIYAAIFALYFLVCWPISLVARRLERKWQFGGDAK